MRWLRPHWLDVLLVLALISLAAFVAWQDDLAAGSPWLALWPNLTVDLFSVWLVARIIEGIVTSRERRRRTALEVRGNLNYTMQRAHDTLPEPREWSVRPLRDEARWMRLKAARSSEPLSREQREALVDAADALDAIVASAEDLIETLIQVRATRGDLEEAGRRAVDSDRQHPRLGEIDPLEDLHRAFDLARDMGTERAAATLATPLNRTRTEVVGLALSPEVASALNSYLEAVERAMVQRTELQRLVDAFVDLVREEEQEILARHG